MLLRISLYVAIGVAGALLGWWTGHELGALAGLAIGSLLWFGLDLMRGMRVLRWLQRNDSEARLSTRGLWGEVADRTRRGFRVRELQAAESACRLQDFLAAVQASPNGVVLLDERGRIEWCNRMAAAQLGIESERDLQQLIGNLVRDPLFASYYAARDFRREVVIPGREGSTARPQHISVQLHPYGQGRQLLLTRDITALEQADTMRRDFVANVSHEIRTPLTVLAGFVETMQNLELPAADRARYLEIMAQQSRRMQALVNDLLTLSQLEGSPLPPDREWTPVATLSAQCEQEASALSRALGKEQDLRFSATPETEVAGARGELLSALSNLVSNAVRYTPAGGTINVDWEARDDGRLVFSVKDTGPGVAPEHLPRLTERFYRVDRSRSRETGGTGLGLAIVKHVLQRHGAELKIASTPGAGSTFSILFPSTRVRANDVPDFSPWSATELLSGTRSEAVEHTTVRTEGHE